MYVRDGLCVTVSEPPIDEANCLQLIVDKKVCILGIYRSPSFRNPSMFLTSLDRHLTSLNNQYIVLAGDININILESSDSPWWQEYLCLVSEFDLAPAITLPTRQGSCLDHIFVKSNKAVIGVVCESDISDHDMVMVGMRLGKIKVNNMSTKQSSDLTDLIIKPLNFDNHQTLIQHYYDSRNYLSQRTHNTKSMRKLLPRNAFQKQNLSVATIKFLCPKKS
ncbi:unnamed protein product [Colias eurytheme]|nr:unnamed protein product [Colias eurytheme]